MVPIDTPRKRIAFLIITITLLSYSASPALAATKTTVAKKAATTTKKTVAVKSATAKKATTTPVKKATIVVKGEKITANKISVVGNNTISTYTVKKGDTLSSIALKFDISVNTLRWSNDLTSKSAINVGQKLTILPTSGVIYTVKSGDTLSGIAVKFEADQDDILNANNLDNANSLKVGMKLTIPNVEPLNSAAAAEVTHDETTPVENISPVEVPTTITQTPAVSPITQILTPAPGTVMTVTNPVTKDTYSINVTVPAAATSYAIPAADIRGYYSQPVSGKLSQGIHDVNAIDIATPVGTTVHAAAEGTVIVAKGDGKYNGGYGSYIVVSHPNGTQTLYAHLNTVTVDLGQVVTQGQPIGMSGKTGKVTGAHLHFEIRGATNPWGADDKGTIYSI
ncbi:MAG: peptidase family protein [Candidatus Nomurabacteria bacterium]|nr:peptidase family protein [Candidatus Nomurabacteria bacterium]